MPDDGAGFVYFRPGADREADTGTEVEPQVAATTEEQQEPESNDDYPDEGTIPEVKDWIGEDLGRARAALDREQDRPGGPRVTLVEHLNDLLEAD